MATEVRGGITLNGVLLRILFSKMLLIKMLNELGYNSYFARNYASFNVDFSSRIVDKDG